MTLRAPLFALLILLSTAALAQTHVSAGIAVGQQHYQDQDDDSRTLTSLEVLLQRHAWGLHAAVEYADLSGEGAMYATHIDVLYRIPLSARWSLNLGAGPTAVNVEEHATRFKWNAEAEVAREWGRATLFVRVRQYDYRVDGFRDFASPSGPALYLGARFVVR